MPCKTWNAFAQVARAHNALIAVDAITSAGCHRVETDEWGLDAVVGGSQKGVMIPPGLGYIALSARAIANACRPPRGLLLRSVEGGEAAEKNDTPYTPAITLMLALRYPSGDDQMRTQTTPSRFSLAHGFELALAAALAAPIGAEPVRATPKIDGSSAARFEASVAAIQNDLRTFSREEFETALAAIWLSNTAGSGDPDRDGDHDADDLRMLREDAFDLLTNIQRGNIANALEQRATDANAATDYFRQVDGLGRDEVVRLASRREATAYLAPLKSVGATTSAGARSSNPFI